MLETIILIPIIAGLLVFVMNAQRSRWLLPITAILHFIYTIGCWKYNFKPYFVNYILLTPDGLLILTISSFLFLMVSIYSVSFLRESKLSDEKLFTSSMLFFFASITLVTISDHLLLFWIAIETTTLASAPLIFMHKTKTAIEATWKYVLICSVGIALALLGTFFIAISRDTAGLDIPLLFSSLSANASDLNASWLKVAFVFILVGYGTKMGLAPMHTWLPDAHSEAPSPAGALLSGALLNTAFLGILKTSKILHEANIEKLTDTLLIIVGLLSMFVAAIFILKQRDYKRMLAYSSVENMGIIAFGIGIGGLAAYGAIFHMIHHSLIKSSLFLSVGNVLMSYKTKLIKKIGNLSNLLPKTFIVLMTGFIAIVGLPPFGLFFSELFIIIGAFSKGAYFSAAFFILNLIVISIGFVRYIIKMSFGETITKPEIMYNNWRIYPQVILLATSLILCYVQFDQMSELMTYISGFTIGRP